MESPKPDDVWVYKDPNDPADDLEIDQYTDANAQRDGVQKLLDIADDKHDPNGRLWHGRPPEESNETETSPFVDWPLRPGADNLVTDAYWEKHPDLPTLSNGWRLLHYNGETVYVNGQDYVVPSGPYITALLQREIPVTVQGHDTVHFADYIRMMQDPVMADAVANAAHSAYIADTRARGVSAEEIKRWQRGEWIRGVGENSRHVVGLWGALTDGMARAAAEGDVATVGEQPKYGNEAKQAATHLAELIRLGQPDAPRAELEAYIVRLATKFGLPLQSQNHP